VGATISDHWDGSETVHPRHRDVKENSVGSQPPDRFEAFDTVAGFGHHSEPSVLLDQGAHHRS